ncbi:hypothetical protein SEA_NECROPHOXINUS_13 [Microbacterium phage Necrophoxinus]|nr:hypothetical protein SEA_NECROPHOXINUS_13 [Microbacterium phage Necrophoxinus]
MALNAILGARLTPQDELRVGDKIFAVRKYPEEVARVRSGDGDLETDGDYYDPHYFDFYLAEREQVKIPDESGRVIELTKKDDKKERWLSWHDFSQGKVLWVKASNGTRQSMSFMQDRANAAKSWEVVL